MSSDRKFRKQEEIRRTILEAARNIIAQEGIEGLSIRKITKSIEYSPAIVYHYFKDKNAIVETIVNEGYGRIIAAVSSVKRGEGDPLEEIKEVFSQYIKLSLEFAEEYKAVMLNDDPLVLRRTGLLAQGISKNSPTMKMLCSSLERGIAVGCFKTSEPELTAQILWTSAFGLIIKLIMEKNVPQEQIDRLLEQHFNMIFHGIVKGEEASS